MIRYTFFYIICAFVFQLNALDPDKKFHQYVHRAWTARDGLPQNSANSIIQTSDGYIWIATQEGLTRFDGVRFKVFSSSDNPGLASNDVRSLAEDSSGGIWIGTYSGGASYYKDGKFTKYTTENGLSENLVKTVYVHKDNSVWLGTYRKGINIIKNGKIQHFSTENGLPDNSIRVIAGDSENIWVGTEKGTAQIVDGKVARIINEKDGIKNGHISSFFIEKNGDLWIGTKGGWVYRLNTSGLETYRIPDLKTTDFIGAVFRDSGGNLWLGSEVGLHKFTEGKFLTFTTRDGLTYNAIRAITEDHEKNLWIGTSGGGINLLTDGRITTLTTRDGLLSGDILPVLADSKGNIWAGTANSGLNLIQKDGNVMSFGIMNGLRGLTDNRLLSLLEAQSGEILAGTVSGLNVIAPDTFEVKWIISEGQPITSPVSSIVEIKNGVFLAGTHGDFLKLIQNNEVIRNIGSEIGLKSGVILTMLKTKNGNILVGTMDGLYLMDSGTLKIKRSYFKKDGLKSSAVYSLFLDKQKNLWIGTDAGLNLIHDGKVYSSMNYDFLLTNAVFSISSDGSDKLWFGSNRGIFSVQRDDILNAILSDSHEFDFRRYGFADGMKSMECNGGFAPAVAQTSDNKLLFPTLEGIAVVDLDARITNTEVPNVIIENITTENSEKKINLQNNIVFPPGTKKFSIKYTATSYKNPSLVKFRYKLESFDENFINAETRRTAYYTNLEPGTYTFHVTASNNEGIWNKKGMKKTVVIRPHFYQTVIFKVFFILILILISMIPLLIISKRKIAKIEKENKILEQRAIEAEKKYEKSRLDDSIALSYLESLFELMENEKLYRNPTLTIVELAEKLDISHLYLSQIINLHTGMTFYTLLSMYRVTEVMEKLVSEQYKDENVITVAFESGFNTKSSFNSVFKKFTSRTPTQYRKKHNKFI